MFQNLQHHHPNTSQAEYRGLNAVSNSDLSNLAAELLGQPRFFNQEALLFGTHFHSAILEPDKYQQVGALLPLGKGELQWKQAGQLAAAVRRRRYPRHVIYTSRGQAEQTFTATHQPTGLLVKVRPDLLIDSPKRQRRTVVDFKTTSCRDLAQFLTTVEKYSYDQQGAFYADVLGAQRVVLIAVQKRAPKGQQPAVWVHELTPPQMEQGRKKYGKLLRCAAEQPLKLVA
ncbi:PD-(D/E)XK nuclease-like domain-containing protein [Hymenobacter lapidiphilus]|uniref:PD-(D/E)XK nuclease-like domain-containing protein n=1 Tax=Hymenobacter lapidiphilus TaxID=2608003 RepID=A0A7Y7PM01_9BACT|nr:PD-(D/E)XK nuclease-like domain-containing protein [Hymenobacter lapidiphilus]NVO30265.1 PD-(D/E)XK nuclease-like domain-containing protein [Hymenobacter lapidiphilus]